MRPFFVAALLALLTGSASRADIIAPGDFFPVGVPFDTILRSTTPRQYQQYISRDLFPQQSLPVLVTGIQVRLPLTSTASWPANDTTFTNYVIMLGDASLALKLSGGVFDPTPAASFATNMVNAVTVYSGPLTIPRNSFIGGVTAFVIPFNVANYQIQPGQYVMLYVSHTVTDQPPGTFTPGFETVSASAALGFSTAVYAQNTQATNFTNPTDPYKVNFVTAARSINISTRGNVGIGGNIMIGGFVITGPTPKKVILRALGPSLGVPPFNVPGVLTNPSLLVFNSVPTQFASNDDWTTLSAADKQTLADNNLTPSNPNESALVLTLSPGAYTAQVVGVAGATGNALIEVYDVDPLSPSTLSNISTRAAVGTVDDVTIAGFIVTGNDSQILIRGIGPSLNNQMVPGALADPTLELHREDGAIIGTNDNWQQASNAVAISATGLAPTMNKESAILKVLPAGKYTCILQGKNATTGVGRIDVFQIP